MTTDQSHTPMFVTLKLSLQNLKHVRIQNLHNFTRGKIINNIASKFAFKTLHWNTWNARFYVKIVKFKNQDLHNFTRGTIVRFWIRRVVSNSKTSWNPVSREILNNIFALTYLRCQVLSRSKRSVSDQLTYLYINKDFLFCDHYIWYICVTSVWHFPMPICVGKLPCHIIQLIY